MCDKRTVLVFGMLLGLAGTASYSDYQWCDPCTWGGSIPTCNDTAVIPNNPNYPMIVGPGCGGCAAVVDWTLNNDQAFTIESEAGLAIAAGVDNGFDWSDGTAAGTMNIYGDFLIYGDAGGGHKSFRAPDDGTGIVNIYPGANVYVEGAFRGADEQGSYYEVNMSGGNVNCGWLMIGDEGGGKINISGGKIVVRDEMNMGGLRGYADITINMTGGLIRVEDKFRFPGSAGRGGHVWMNLDGGAVDCNQFVHGGSGGAAWTDDWRVDIGGGQLRIWGDVRAQIGANVASGQITAYDDDGTVTVALIDGNTVVTSVPPDPNTATNPNPANNQTRVPLEATLSWTPGCVAASHDVYLGTNFEDVNEANNSWPVGQSVYRGNQSLDANDYDPCCLASGVRHYWRIDEVNGTEVHRGCVWTFESRYVVPDIRLLFYRFNETSPNSIAHDCRESGPDADVNGPVDGWDPTGGYCNGCRVFNNDTAVIVPSEILYDVHWSISVTVWVNGKIGQTPGKDMPIFDVGDPCRGAAYRMTALAPNANGHVVWRAGDDSNDVLVWEGASPQDWQGRWHHFAFLKDEYSGEMTIYFDGWPAASKSGVSASLAQIVGKPFKIGAYTYHDSGYEGRLDDFKIWNMAQTRCRLRPSMCMPPPPYAWAPRPYNGEVNVAPDVNLVWEPGEGADSHNVYFGTDLSDVNDANTTSDVYQGSQGPNVFDLNTLDLETEYYWRIDQVNGPNVWKGPAWVFTTANYVVVDDVEGYDPQQHIYYLWNDGAINETGSYLDLAVEPFSPVHGGEYSMQYIYDNRIDWGAGYYSEAELPFYPPQDWTSLGTKALTLHLYGDPDNDANETEQLYVGLGGSYAQVNYPDMNDVKRSEWTEWNIAIADFTGVDPCAVTSLFIGFGDRDNNTVPGGDGIVYFDDIRLYPPRCVPDKAKPRADLNGDCVVDYEDLKIMADDWLCSGSCAADLYPDSRVDLKDCAVLLNLWLERELWPQ